MKEIKLTPEELKAAIDFGKLIGSGFFSKVFTYKGKLIKMDNNLYTLLKANDPVFSKSVIKDHYKWEKNNFNDREQLEELAKRQPHIRTKVPEGIITIKDQDKKIDGVSPGIIIPYFEGYDNLKKFPHNEYKQLLILLRKVFDDIKNLADNEIAQEDLYHTSKNKKQIDSQELLDYNIVQKGNDAQIIDMSGPMVKVGKDFNGADRMYQEFAGIINHYYRYNGLKPIHEENEDINENKIADMITEFEIQTKKR